MLTQGLAADPKSYTFAFTRLSHFYQECHVHCVVITNDRGGIGERWSIYIRVWMGGQRVGIILKFLFVFFFRFCVLFSHVLGPLFKLLEHNG